jgi:hypothetical protein
MRRRLITSLATGLLLLAGFTAAAVASGGSPLDLIASRATTTPSVSSMRSAKPKRPVTPASPRGSTAEVPDADTGEDGADAAEPKSTMQSEHKVVICHHTGSWKHPFHPISVDEHSVTAHTRHGDTLGNCPSAPASAPRTSTHGKPPWAHGRKEHARGRGPVNSTGPVNRSHNKGQGPGPTSAPEHSGKH